MKDVRIWMFLLISLWVLFPTVSVAESPIACTMEYAPVCASKQVQCIKAPCYPVYQTYGNKCMASADGATFVYTGECIEEGMGTACTEEWAPVCGQKTECPACTSSNPPCMAPCSLTQGTYSNTCMLNADGATFVHNGECTEEGYGGGGTNIGGNYTPPPGCTAWFDGCNNCSKGPGGIAMCTLRACMGEPAPGYCTSYDTVTPPGTEPPASGGGTSGGASSPPSGGGDGSVPPVLIDENPEEKPTGLFATLWYYISNWFAYIF